MSKDKEGRKEVLGDHKRIGKKFLPPMRQFPNLDIDTTWQNDILPELVWMLPIYETLELREAIELALEIVRTATSVYEKQGKKQNFTLLSSFALLSTEQKTEIIAQLESNGFTEKTKQSLDRFFRLYPQSPLNFLSTNSADASQADKDWFEPILDRFYNRRNHISMLIQSNVIYHQGVLGKLFYSSHVEPPNLEAIVFDFDGAEGRMASSSVRASVNAILGMSRQNSDKTWTRYFWHRNMELADQSDLNVPQLSLEKLPEGDPWDFIGKYIKCCLAGLTERWRKLPKDIFNPEATEVVGAFLARQMSIARRIARNPDTWDYHVGPILLRSMVDAHITLAWLLKDAPTRSRKLILYGLGQEKLHLEKLKQKCAAKSSDELKLMIDATEDWINIQQYSFLTIVDVGSWSGLSVRAMAEEAELADLYDFAYTPWSSCAHSMWNHIERFNTRHSDSAYLKHIRIPDELDINPQIDILLNSAKYLQRSFEAIDSAYGLAAEEILPYDYLITILSQNTAGNTSPSGKEDQEVAKKDAG